MFVTKDACQDSVFPSSNKFSHFIPPSHVTIPLPPRGAQPCVLVQRIALCLVRLVDDVIGLTSNSKPLLPLILLKLCRSRESKQSQNLLTLGRKRVWGKNRSDEFFSKVGLSDRSIEFCPGLPNSLFILNLQNHLLYNNLVPSVCLSVCMYVCLSVCA